MYYYYYTKPKRPGIWQGGPKWFIKKKFLLMMLKNTTIQINVFNVKAFKISIYGPSLTITDKTRRTCIRAYHSCYSNQKHDNKEDSRPSLVTALLKTETDACKLKRSWHKASIVSTSFIFLFNRLLFKTFRIMSFYFSPATKSPFITFILKPLSIYYG